MAIGLVDDNEFQAELDRLSGVRVATPEVVIEPLPTKGRNTGDNNVPESLRKIIGETSVIDGRQEALRLAEQFGISSSSVSAYAKGATSTTTYNSPAKEIIAHINKSRQRAIKKSNRVLNAALEAITQDKLDYADATDLSGIAKDMSVIIKNLEPPTPSVDPEAASNVPQFVIFAPTFRDERTYESITVKE
jgi:hypothetical protein